MSTSTELALGKNEEQAYDWTLVQAYGNELVGI